MARDYAKASSKKKSSVQSSGGSRLSSGMLWLFIGVMVGLLIPSFAYIKQHVTSIVQGKKQSGKNELLRDPLPQKTKPGQPNEVEEVEQQTTPTENKKVNNKAIDESANDDQVDFDFYTILPDSNATKPPITKTVQTPEKSLERPEKTLETAEQNLLAPAAKNPTATPKQNKKEEVALPMPQIKTPAQTAAESKPIAKPTPPKPIGSATPTAPVAPAKPTTKPTSGYILQLGSFKTFEEADQLKAQLSLSGLQAKIKQTTINGITRQRVWVGIYPSLEAAEKAQQKLAESSLKSSLAQVR